MHEVYPLCPSSEFASCRIRVSKKYTQLYEHYFDGGLQRRLTPVSTDHSSRNNLQRNRKTKLSLTYEENVEITTFAKK